MTDSWNTELGSYVELPIGTPHPDVAKWPGYILVKQQAFDGDEKWIQRFWSADSLVEDTYNLARRAFSGGDVTKDIYTRTYAVRRKDYEPLAKLSTLSGVLYVRITAGGSGYDSTTTVAFTGGAGSGATGVPIIFRGAVVGVRITAEGTGYTSNPTVTFTGIGAGATATAGGIRQNALAVLVDEQADRMDGEPDDGIYLKVTRIYEVLPGPYLPFTRYDLLLGPIQGRRRAVANTGQAATLTATVKTTYEAREGSSIVSWEIEETNSDGTGGAGNPAYPITIDDFYDDVRGAVHQVTQLVADVASPGSLAVNAGGTLATLTRYDAYNAFLRRKIVETWALPGPTITTSHYDPASGIKITEARTLKRRDGVGGILEANAISGTTDADRVLTVTEIERTGIGAVLGIEVVTTYPAAAAYDTTTAIVEVKEAPYRYPGLCNIYRVTGGPLFSIFGGGVDVGNAATGIHKSRAAWPESLAATLVPHTVKTWFVNSLTKPIVTAFNEIRPKSITLADGETTHTFDNVLFDAATLTYAGGSYAAIQPTIPATVPDFTTYVTTWIGNSKVIDGEIKELRRFRWKVTTVEIIMR